MWRRRAVEYHPGGDGRPLGGQVDGVEELFDFKPVFERAVSRVTDPGSDTRRSLHELVCIVATRLHLESAVLHPLGQSSTSAGGRSTATTKGVEMTFQELMQRSPVDRAAFYHQWPKDHREMQPELAAEYDQVAELLESF
jgi:hypothetical protein